AAGAVMPVIDRHLIAGGAELVCCGKTGWPGADNANALRNFLHRPDRLHPAALPRSVGDVALDRADGDGAVPGLFDDASALTQPILWTDAAADFRHVRSGRGDFIRLLQPPLCGELQPVRDVVLQRAVRLTKGNAA